MMNNHPECCGWQMNYAEVFGVRIYVCSNKYSHPGIIQNLYTGERVSDKDLTWHTKSYYEDDI